MTTLVWFRRDLRLRDNPAFHEAWQRGNAVIPVYVFSPDEEAPWQPGGASRWYLHQSLKALKQQLASLGLPLLLVRGGSAESLLSLAQTHSVCEIVCNRVYEPALARQEASVRKLMQSMGIALTCFHDHSLLPPGSVLNGSHKPYKVFTPFWRSLSEQLLSMPGHCGLFPLSQTFEPGQATLESMDIDSLGLLDVHGWHEKLHQHWQAGEQAALEKLDGFVEESLEGYPQGRDLPAEHWTSRLSAALHFGEISPWRIIDTLKPAYMGDWGEAAAKAGEAFLRQLGWREFGIQLLHHHPDSAGRSLNEAFEGRGVWFDDPEARERWCAGKTGIALVDAGMAELWETGYMHNRVRMVVASLLTKNLGQHWIHGARWFWDTLVDADLANNTMGWQWVAGCGVDAAPYYRIFNPDTQALRFDPKGHYVQRWTDGGLASPTVDLKQSRQRALERHKQLKTEL